MSPRRLVGSWRKMLARRGLLVGINRRNVALVYPNNPRHNYTLADDKLRTKEILGAAGVPTPKTLATCRGLYDIPAALRILRNEDSFVLKPASSSGGQGILVVTRRDGLERWRTAGGRTIDLRLIERHLAQTVFGAFSRDRPDQALVEERVVSHPFFEALWPEGLCDVRVITLHTRPLMAMVRVPTRRSEGRANLHQGGLGLAVDLADGRIHRAWSRRGAIRHHPESGAALVGEQVPGWERLLDIAVRSAQALPLGYLGVDLAVDVGRGPLVLEVNVRPGLEIQNVTGMPLGAALNREVA